MSIDKMHKIVYMVLVIFNNIVNILIVVTIYKNYYINIATACK